MNYTETDLYLAIKNNNLTKLIEILRRYNLTKYEFFNNKITFISLAVISNTSELVIEKLIEHGADVNRLSYISYEWPVEGNVFKSFETALITSTRHGNKSLCELLCKHNSKVNKLDSFSMTALHWAASLNLVSVIEVLFKYDANPNVLDLKNQTPIDKAIQNGNAEIVKLFAQKFSLQYRFREYLIASIKNTNIEIFEILIGQIKCGKVKFDLNMIDDAVGSLLHYAVILSNALNNKVNLKNGQATYKIVENLVEDLGAQVNSVNKYGETPLHMSRSVEVARLLISAGAQMNICEISGKMPFFSFILRDNFDICVELLKSGCDLKNKDKLGNSLLFALINSNAPVGLILLILSGIDLSDEDWLMSRKYPKKLQKHPKLVNAIEWRLKNPPTLKELSRKSLRSHLIKINRSKSILKSVSGLEKHLPSELQDYVCFDLKNFKSILIK